MNASTANSVNVFVVLIVFIKAIWFLFCYKISFTTMGFSFCASLSCDCTHFMPLLRMALLPPTWVLGKRPFFSTITFMASNATQIAIINNVNNKVLNISINFVMSSLGTVFLGCAKIVLFIVLRVNELPKKGKKQAAKRIINNILRNT